jgi:tetratricopeptide (TPR) repeat protein
MILTYGPIIAAESNPESPRQFYVAAQQLIVEGETADARRLLQTAIDQHPSDISLLTLHAQNLFKLGLLGEAQQATKSALAVKHTETMETLSNQIADLFSSFTTSRNKAKIVLGKYKEDGDFKSAVTLAELAIAKWPEDDHLQVLKGQTLMALGQLQRAEIAFRIALVINPLNQVAKTSVETIRTTEQAQTSAELAEWIGIAKDKVGDFVVTFLALFTAFATNSLIAPLALRYKLNRSRRSLDSGDYDEFTDLMEALLDLENFAPIRTNFQFLLKHRSYTEAQRILNRYVNTAERLPTLLRILERENEKLQAT